MLNTIKSLVKQEHPSYLMSFDVVSRGELSAVTCRWGKEQEYYVAVAFYTSTWVSDNPFGPRGIFDVRPVTSISDVANVLTFRSMELCRAYPGVRESDLDYLFAQFKAMTDSVTEKIEPLENVDIVRCNFQLVPVPMLAFSVRTIDEELVGTISVMANGLVMPVMVCSDRLMGYVEQLKRIVGSCGWSYSFTSSLYLPGTCCLLGGKKDE